DVLNDAIKQCREAQRILDRCGDIANKHVQCGNEILDLGKAGSEFANAWVSGRSGQELDRFLKVQKRLLDCLKLLAEANSELANELFKIVYRDRDIDDA